MNRYFDNAATSFPKPEQVYGASEKYLRSYRGNPGRSFDFKNMAYLYQIREKIASFFNTPDPATIVFTFNATDALNIAIKGFVKKGDSVIYTAMEHNSVLRPLGGLVRKGEISTTMIPCFPDGTPDLDFLSKSISKQTSLLVVNHASNVCGTLAPLAEMIKIARNKNVKVLVDAAQSAGVIPIDLQALDPDMLAFTGHKGLLGPPGTGGLYVRKGLLLSPLREGGTGSYSESDAQPTAMPERLEAGTLNSAGLAGLAAGIDYIREIGIENVYRKEKDLCNYLVGSLQEIPHLSIHGKTENSLAVVSFTIDGKDAGEIGFMLEDRYGITCRTGLHCAPFAHQALNTFPAGTVRLSPGCFTEYDDIDYLISAVKDIAK